LNSLKFTISKSATSVSIDSWEADLIEEPQLFEEALIPTLMFKVKISNKASQPRTINHLSGKIFVGREVRPSLLESLVEFKYLTSMEIAYIQNPQGVLAGHQPPYTEGVILNVANNSYVEVTFFANLLPQILDRIESTREGGDVLLMLKLEITYGGWYVRLPVNYGGRPYIRIAKSDWVENILKKIGYLDVTMVELPEPADIQELRSAISYLREAWKSYRSGEYYEAVLNVRRALDALTRGLENKDQNLVSRRQEDNRTIIEPNFKAFANTEREREAIEKVYRILHSTLGGLSAHEGAVGIDKWLAEFSVITGQALVRYFTARLKYARGYAQTSS